MRPADRGGRLTLLHGFTGSRAAWSPPALACLREAGVDPLPLDLPGHGRRGGEADPARFSLAATLAGIRAAHPESGDLLGYSMGGRLALHFALRHPDRVRRLVLESASPGLEDQGDRRERVAADERLALLLEDRGIEAFVDLWERLPLFASQESLDVDTRARLRARRLSNDARSLAASLRGVGTGVLPSLWGELHHIQVPTLVLVGALDTKFVEIGRRMAERLPECTVEVVEGAGHAIHLERPSEWCGAVARFLTEPRTAAAPSEAGPPS